MLKLGAVQHLQIASPWTSAGLNGCIVIHGSTFHHVVDQDLQQVLSLGMQMLM